MCGVGVLVQTLPIHISQWWLILHVPTVVYLPLSYQVIKVTPLPLAPTNSTPTPTDLLPTDSRPTDGIIKTLGGINEALC